MTASLNPFFVIQISEAFKRFGISDDDNSVLVVLVHKYQDDKQLVLDITAKVDGRQVPLEDLSTLTDLDKIKKVSHFLTICCNVHPLGCQVTVFTRSVSF